MSVRLERVGERIGERRSVKSLHLHYFLADGKRCLERSGAMRVKSYRGSVLNPSCKPTSLKRIIS